MANIPERFGRYEVIRRIGYGGMGTVYLARDPGLDRLLAIKVLSDLLFEDEVMQRFLREARAAGNLRHQNIITVYDTGHHEHQPFMAMEYVDGISFAEIIRARQPLSLADKLSYLEQVCAGLHHAHSQGIVHRDIKPANLMVDRRQVVRILDFGIARIEGSGMTQDGALIGTLNYMSPEQMLGRPIDHRSDVFGFGAVAYELIAYEKAFPGTINDGLLHRLPSDPPRPLSELCPGLPEGLEALILRALGKQPKDRYADLEEARFALNQIRRQLDPTLDVEPIAGSRRGAGLVSTPTPGSMPSSTERREFVERRAVQVSYHRDAARMALAAQELDAAVAACEDALTLDPGDQEAQKLLADIEQARERRGLETKERRDRDRTVRKHLADADLKLSKGDVQSAAGLLQQALTLDPGNAAALALQSRLEQTNAGHVVMPTVLVPQSRRQPSLRDASAQSADTAAALERTDASAEVSEASRQEPVGSVGRRGPLVAIAAVAILALGAGLLWIMSREDAPSGTTATIADGNTQNTRPAAPVEPAPASETPGPEPAAPATPDVSAAPAPAPAPAAVPAPAPTPTVAPADVRPTVRIELGPIENALSAGDIPRALSLLDVLPNQGDAQVQGAARRIAERSMDLMAAAETSAAVYKAAELASTSFAAGAEAKVLAQRAFTRADYRQAGRQGVTATTSFRRAADEARVAGETARRAEEAARNAKREETTAAPPPRAEAPAAATAKPPEAPRLSALDSQGILDALNRFKKAYVGRDVNGIRRLITTVTDQQVKVWRSNFDACRSVNVDFSGLRTLVAPEDPTSATVHVRSTYYCQPKIRAPELENAQDDVFTLRKVSENWVIDRMGALN